MSRSYRSRSTRFAARLTPIAACIELLDQRLCLTAPTFVGSIDDAIFTRGAPPLVIDSGLSLTPDEPGSADGLLLTATITDGAAKSDRLGVFSIGEGHHQISVRKKTIIFEEAVVATFAGGRKSKPLQITFNSAATFDAAESVARAITFFAKKKAAATDRTVRLIAETSPSESSAPVSIDIRIEDLDERAESPPVFGGSGGVSEDTTGGLTGDARFRADQLVSAFENSTTVIQYGYIENIGDGRGFTAGRAGFTTATGDFLLVVQQLTELVPDNPLAEYLPRLEELAEAESDSVSGLDGIAEAWAETNADAELGSTFRQVQDDVVDELYYTPAVAHWRALGLTSNLSLAALYDTNIQHGEGEDPDSLGALIDRASERIGGTPAGGVGEAEWLSHFLQVRRETLAFATDPSTRQGWAESVERVDVYRSALAAGNLSLDAPITFYVYGDVFTTS